MSRVKINLAVLLAERKMKQKDLIDITGIRKNTINDLYHELALGIKFEHLEKICDALDCTASDLIKYIPDKK